VVSELETPFSMKKVAVWSLSIGCVLVSLLLSSCNQSKEDLQAVSLCNPIPVITTGQTPLFLAKEKGFFAQEGLDVSFDQGSRELSPIKMVESGRNDFGMMGGPDSVIIARSKGIPVKAVAVLHRNSDFVCLVTLKSSGLTKLEQLDGKQVGMYYGHISTDVLRSLFAKEGINVEEVNVGFDYNQLISGQVAAQWAFTVRAVLQLPAQGVDINVIRPADYGIRTHGYTIFALEETIEEKPEMVMSFLRAVRNGVDYSLKHPAEGHDLIMEINSSLTSREFVETSQDAFDAATSHSEEYPIGYLDRQMFEETYERLNSLGVLENEFDIDEVYTTEFVEALAKESSE